MSKIQLKERIIPATIDEILSKTRTSGSMITIKGVLKRVSSKAFGKVCFDINDYVGHPDKVIEYFESLSIKPRSISSQMNTIIKTLECYPEIKKDPTLIQPYLKYYAEVKSRFELYVTANPDKKLDLKWSDVETYYRIVTKAFSEMVRYDPKLHKKYLALSLYALFPPLRPSEWLGAEMIADGKTSEKNHLDLTSGMMTIINQKSKSFPIRKFEIPSNVLEIIKDWLSRQKRRQYLIYDRSGKVLTANNFGHFLETNCRVTKADGTEFPLGANYLRNLFISQKLIDVNLSMVERMRIAYIMGHTIQTQHLVYSKYSQSLHPEKKEEEEEDLPDEPEEKIVELPTEKKKRRIIIL